MKYNSPYVYFTYKEEFVMTVNTLNKAEARFDTRLPKEQKELFEKAAKLGGFRSLTDFVISTVQEKAREIVSEREQILASERDAKIFFEALMNPPEPNSALKAAAKKYKEKLSR